MEPTNAPTSGPAAGAVLAPRLPWRVATVAEVAPETPRVRTLRLDVPGWPGHRAGQHVDVRLTAPDGYRVERSYSIASAPATPNAPVRRIELTVERIEGGEVSPYLTDELRPGDGLELRGPVGGYFTWAADDGGPLFLVAGGSGVVPLAAMARTRAAHAGAAHGGVPARLLYSARTAGDLIFRAELDALGAGGSGFRVAYALTRERPAGWAGYARRVDAAMLADAGWEAAERPLVFVCGPTPFVEAVATACVALGHAPERIKTERFGSTGA
ncbi:oxidoreductase [Gemmatimonadetes bacterium T265]|nr:oxidoreductase [Gemmatimonadetes bacterium T265]